MPLTQQTNEKETKQQSKHRSTGSLGHDSAVYLHQQAEVNSFVHIMDRKGQILGRGGQKKCLLSTSTTLHKGRRRSRLEVSCLVDLIPTSHLSPREPNLSQGGWEEEHSASLCKWRRIDEGDIIFDGVAPTPHLLSITPSTQQKNSNQW